MKPLLSLVVPVYFEEECILQFIRETKVVLDTLPLEYEYIFIDDGSTDNTVALIQQEAVKDKRIKLIVFSYNQGKQAAVSAGIRFASGEYLLYMDPDLQDPPEEIPRFWEEIQKGYDLVFGVRKEKMDSGINKLMSWIFWSVLERFTGLKLPKGLAVMRIFNQNFARQFLEYREQNRFIEGIFMHIGKKRTQIVIGQRERFAGKTKFRFKQKMQLAFDAILDFSEIPLKMAIRMGLGFAALGAFSLITILILKVFFIDFQTGWPSIFSVVVFGTGINLFFTGIAAIYIGKIYKEVKNRPLFSFESLVNLEKNDDT